MNKNLTRWILILVSVLLLCNIIFIYKWQQSDREYTAIKTQNDSLQKFIGRLYIHPELICDSILTRENLLSYIKLKGIKWPNVVWAQSMVETGYLTCDNCCLGSNNLFGFMLGGKCMDFRTWQECVDYYARWQIKYLKPKEDYLTFLKRVGYATFKEYQIHVAQILLDNKLAYQPK
jgi:hypothetical protein